MFSMLFGSSITKYLIGGTLVALLAGGAYFYYKDSQARIADLTASNAVLTVANDGLTKSLEVAQQSAAEQQRLSNDLQIQLSDEEARLNTLRSLLLRHDLTNLALNKPGLIERRINDATSKVFSDIMSDTSSSQ